MALNLNEEFSPFIACENKFGSSLCPMSTSDSRRYTTCSLRIVDLLILQDFLNSTSSAFCNGIIDFEPVLYELVVLEVIVAQDNQSDFP
jgi:hypothetical protein